MMTEALLILVTVLLVARTEPLVRGASRLAALMGISPLVAGLTSWLCWSCSARNRLGTERIRET